MHGRSVERLVFVGDRAFSEEADELTFEVRVELQRQGFFRRSPPACSIQYMRFDATDTALTVLLDANIRKATCGRTKRSERPKSSF